jgi:hypothetical protein
VPIPSIVAVALARGMLNDPRRPWHTAAQLGAFNRRTAAILALATSNGKRLPGATVSRGALKILRLPVSVFDAQCGLLLPASRVDHWLYSSFCMAGRITGLKKRLHLALT